MHGFIWLLIPLVFFFGMRGGWWGGRPRRGRGLDRADRDYVAELARVVETQQEQIEALEGRVARVEEGLDFAERVLGERAPARLES
jgi:hypothetical protein